MISDFKKPQIWPKSGGVARPPFPHSDSTGPVLSATTEIRAMNELKQTARALHHNRFYEGGPICSTSSKLVFFAQVQCTVLEERDNRYYYASLSEYGIWIVTFFDSIQDA